METINGKRYIIHQVDAKESLYSIARRYGVPITDLAQENPNAGSGIVVGQILRVPYIPRVKPKSIENGNTVHKVAPKETLFSISKLYDVSLDDLKSWNNLKDNSLNVGQDLIIRKKSNSVQIKPTETKPTETKPVETKTARGTHTVLEKETLYSISKMYGASLQQLKSWNNLTSDDVKPGQVIYVIEPMNDSAADVNKPTQEFKNSELVIGSEEVHEKGMATLMDGSDGVRKYFAQHKTVKPGTIMKVRNDATQREVFVRVISQLNANDDSIIKISKSAYDKLGATDTRFPVEIIRYK
ncbi:MAG: LysM peptidoglycan-binding domain-containing protein [Cyclobacteriaceae bacterium]